MQSLDREKRLAWQRAGIEHIVERSVSAAANSSASGRPFLCAPT
jgi:hypothetical protein